MNTNPSQGITRRYLVTIHDAGNITDDPRNIHTILTSTDHILPRERVEVEIFDEDEIYLDRGSAEAINRITEGWRAKRKPGVCWCGREAKSGWTTCTRHYSSGRAS